MIGFKNTNLTTQFLLHTFKHNKKLFKANGFKKAYIGDVQHDTIHDNCLYLEFIPNKESEEYQEFEKLMLESGLIVDLYEIDNQVIFVAQVVEKFHNDLSLFIDGKYSEFSKELKSRMCSTEDTLVRGIVDKEEYARVHFSKLFDIEIPRNQEYYSKPNLKYELLRYEESIVEQH